MLCADVTPVQFAVITSPSLCIFSLFFGPADLTGCSQLMQLSELCVICGST